MKILFLCTVFLISVAQETQSESKALDHIVIDVEDNSKSLFIAA